ncbi:MAG: TlpA family protein disulfide reductase [Anaerolineaceae bacterium]|nr:TlpA family protein disulfide reductase [Anaerolineaceae bacterium]
MKRKKWLTILFSVLSIYLVWILTSAILYKPVKVEKIYSPARGFYAPAFTLSTLDGNSFTLSDHIGKPMLVTLWASWCGPCKAEMPDFNQVYKEMQDEILIVGVNVTNQDSLLDVTNFVAENDLIFPILLDTQGEVADLYQLQGLPMTFVIDSEGIIQQRIVGGPISAASVRGFFSELMRED